MWLSEEGRVSHARVNACEAGPKNMVEVMLHIVEKTTLGVYCNDGLGMTGLIAALGPTGSRPEKGSRTDHQESCLAIFVRSSQKS